MHVVIENIRDGEIYTRPLAEDESLDAKFQAERWVEQEYGNDGGRIHEEGHVPSGCGDYCCTVQETREWTGVCWSSYDFFVTFD